MIFSPKEGLKSGVRTDFQQTNWKIRPGDGFEIGKLGFLTPKKTPLGENFSQISMLEYAEKKNCFECPCTKITVFGWKISIGFTLFLWHSVPVCTAAKNTVTVSCYISKFII